MKFKAVLFDLDGTLLDTLEDLGDSMNAVLGRRGLPTHEMAKYKVFVGDGITKLAIRALPEALREDGALVADVVAEMRAEYAAHWAVKTRAYDGVPELLDALAERGVRMAVLSNKPDDFTKTMTAHMLPRWKFEWVIGDRGSTPPKPHPGSAFEIAANMGLEPREFLYLGDTNTDMMTATAAGMHPVGVLWGFRTGGELAASGARELIERPMDVLDILQSNSE